MKTHPPFDLIRDLLDHEIVDAEGVPCGMVDDLLLTPDEHGPRITALLVGSGPASERLPALLRLAARGLGLTRRVRVPFEQLDTLAEVVTLKSRAAELGLGIADRRAARWLGRVPGT
jgi:sporulation protein YlmC with PRC-barrel domain